MTTHHLVLNIYIYTLFMCGLGPDTRTLGIKPFNPPCSDFPSYNILLVLGFPSQTRLAARGVRTLNVIISLAPLLGGSLFYHLNSFSKEELGSISQSENFMGSFTDIVLGTPIYDFELWGLEDASATWYDWRTTCVMKDWSWNLLATWYMIRRFTSGVIQHRSGKSPRWMAVSS